MKKVSFFTVDCSEYPAVRTHGDFRVIHHGKYQVFNGSNCIGIYDKLSLAKERIEREELV